MPRRPWRSFSISPAGGTAFILILASLLACAVTSRADDSRATVDPRQYELADVVGLLTEAVTSIDSLYCEYTVTQSPAEDGHPPQRCIFARTGTKWHIARWPADAHEPPGDVEVVCYDGSRAYTYRKAVDGNRSTRLNALEIHDSQMPPLFSPDQLIGVRIPSTDQTVTTLCEAGHFEKRTEILADGTVALRLTHREVPDRWFAKEIAFVVDPTHDMLPVEIQISYSATSLAKVPEHKRAWFQRWRTLQFARVLDEFSNSERWYPQRAILEQPNPAPSIVLAIDTIRLNPRLDVNLFSPQIPSGTQIVDATADGRGTIRFAGGSKAISHRMKELKELSDLANDTPKGRSLRWLWIVNGVLIAAILVAVFTRCRKSRRRSDI